MAHYRRSCRVIPMELRSRRNARAHRMSLLRQAPAKSGQNNSGIIDTQICDPGILGWNNNLVS